MFPLFFNLRENKFVCQLFHQQQRNGISIFRAVELENPFVAPSDASIMIELIFSDRYESFLLG